jgi:release factor glutamine methyltransferase
MTVGNALQEGQSRLFYAEVDTPLLDATVLLCEALDTTKERLLASLPEPLPEECYRRYSELLSRRSAGVPVSYLRGKKEFFSLEFRVDERVLVPRPDTEILVEEALRILDEHRSLRRIHDACTGSGCVAIALKHSRPDLEISTSDLLPQVREVFAENARRILGSPLACGKPFGAEAASPFFTAGAPCAGTGSRPVDAGAAAPAISFTLSDLLADVRGPFDLITANPPYLSDREVENLLKIGWPEPPQALRGGPEGLDLLERLIRQAPERLARPGWLVLEAAPPQMQALKELLTGAGFEDVAVVPDLAGRARVIRGSLRPRLRGSLRPRLRWSPS